MRGQIWVLLASWAVGALLAALADRLAPFPSADTRRASEGPFLAAPGDLHDREFLPPLRGPGRWTGYRARFAFDNLPEGPAWVEVSARGHRSAVRVSSGQYLLGKLEPIDEVLVALAPPSPSGHLEITLTTEPFVSGNGRRLGTLLERVMIRHEAARIPRWRWVGSLGAAAVVVAIAAMAAGASPLGALVYSLAASLLVTTLLLPEGLIRSAYAQSLALQVPIAAACAAVFSRMAIHLRPGIGRAAFIAFFAAGASLVIAALHPMVVGLDAVFHAHKLGEVAAGNWRPLSLTQHEPPFRFPYGVSFQALLSPLYRVGLDASALVRSFSAASAFAALMGFFLLIASRGPSVVAVLAIVAFQLLPGTVAVFSNANYSNIFGQACTLLFFVWWASGARGGGWYGGVLLAMAGLAHLSVFIFCCVLTLALIALRLDLLRSDPQRRMALFIGVGLASAYYLQFLPLIVEQLHRLNEGAGSSGRATILGSLWEQVRNAVQQWGVPSTILAAAGFPDKTNRDERAYWLAAAALALCASFTPVEVRYLYALSPLLALAAARGACRLWSFGGLPRAATVALCAGQAVIGLRAIASAILRDWRI